MTAPSIITSLTVLHRDKYTLSGTVWGRFLGDWSDEVADKYIDEDQESCWSDEGTGNYAEEDCGSCWSNERVWEDH